MKALNFLLKFQRETIGGDENDFLTATNKVDKYHAQLIEKETNGKLNPFEKLYQKLHNGPWFDVLSPFIMMLLRKEWNKIANNEDHDDYNRRRLDDY